jgi:hypothetical protein
MGEQHCERLPSRLNVEASRSLVGFAETQQRVTKTNQTSKSDCGVVYCPQTSRLAVTVSSVTRWLSTARL